MLALGMKIIWFLIGLVIGIQSVPASWLTRPGQEVRPKPGIQLPDADFAMSLAELESLCRQKMEFPRDSRRLGGESQLSVSMEYHHSMCQLYQVRKQVSELVLDRTMAILIPEHLSYAYDLFTQVCALQREVVQLSHAWISGQCFEYPLPPVLDTKTQVRPIPVPREDDDLGDTSMEEMSEEN